MVTTTSAVGISPIMRRCAISRCILRMRPLTSGLPSDSLASWRTSSLVIISFLLCSYSWNGTSTAAISSIPPMMAIKQPHIRWPSPGIAAASGWVINSITPSRLCQIAHAPTPPTTSALAIALSNSTRLLVENMRPMPAMGLSLENFGCNGCRVNSQPFSNMGAMTAASSSTIRNGSSANSASFDSVCRCGNIYSVS